jgi:biotin/methionine sulfoxide reductase
MPGIVPTCTHWGNYRVETKDGRLSAVLPYAEDIEPTPIGQSLLESQDPQCRVPQPMVRAGYLERQWHSDGSGRGVEPFVPVSWEQASRLAADSLQRVSEHFGNESIYGGSYGWASAGRFHHAQSQVHRFLNCLGGYTRSVNSYSAAAAEVIMPHVLGIPFMKLVYEAPTSADVARHTKTMLLFGGSAMKNTQVNAGGLGAHSAAKQWRRIHDAGVRVVNVSPVRDDIADFVDAEWWACRPNSDVAIMLGLAHTLYAEGLHDQAFLDRYCEGFEAFVPYLTGASDGVAKDAAWAASLSGIAAADIVAMARSLAAERSVLGISWSLQRQQHGEQPYWMITVLGAMLGQIGLPGGGVAYGYGCIHNMGFSGRRLPPFRFAAMPQGRNPVDRYIPVARIADLLLNPGAEIDYNGKRIVFPEIRLVYWAGGNPFHHHQDLNRLRQAWARPETVIVNEPFWTATARHADIVFPCTTSLERNDFGGGSDDLYISPMRQAVPPFAGSRSDFDIFTGLADLLGIADEFTAGRSEMARRGEGGRATARFSTVLGRRADVFRAAGSGAKLQTRAFPRGPGQTSAADAVRPNRDLLVENRLLRLR